MDFQERRCFRLSIFIQSVFFVEATFVSIGTEQPSRNPGRRSAHLLTYLIQGHTDWNDQTKAEEWRAAWAEYVNGALKRGNLNQEIEVTNQRLRLLKARIAKLQTWLKEAQAEKSGYSQSLYNLKDEVKEAVQIRKSIYNILR